MHFINRETNNTVISLIPLGIAGIAWLFLVWVCCKFFYVLCRLSEEDETREYELDEMLHQDIPMDNSSFCPRPIKPDSVMDSIALSIPDILIRPSALLHPSREIENNRIMI